jgi:hypothetical protein
MAVFDIENQTSYNYSMPDEDSSQQTTPPVEDVTQPAPLPTDLVETPVAETPDTPPESVPTMPDNSSISAPVAEDNPPADVPVPISNVAPSPAIAPAPDHSSSAYLKSLVPLSLAERNRRRQAHIEKLINHAAANGSTSRREAQLLLKVTGASADRYIRELISQGRLAKENNARYTKYKFVR